MAYLHEILVCHRYICPKNIFYDEATGDIKITNFFYSTYYQNSTKLLNEDIGLPSYCCNEIYKREFYDPQRVDVWASGILLFMMLYVNFFYFSSFFFVFSIYIVKFMIKH